MATSHFGKKKDNRNLYFGSQRRDKKMSDFYKSHDITVRDDGKIDLTTSPFVQKLKFIKRGTAAEPDLHPVYTHDDHIYEFNFEPDDIDAGVVNIVNLDPINELQKIHNERFQFYSEKVKEFLNTDDLLVEQIIGRDAFMLLRTQAEPLQIHDTDYLKSEFGWGELYADFKDINAKPSYLRWLSVKSEKRNIGLSKFIYVLMNHCKSVFQGSLSDSSKPVDGGQTLNETKDDSI